MQRVYMMGHEVHKLGRRAEDGVSGALPDVWKLPQGGRAGCDALIS